jgi:ceramide glucosyltransferase
MMPAARHDILILSDSDIAVDPDYLARVLSALDQPNVGAVTCLYRGRGDAGFWSRFGAAGQTYQFIISVVIAVSYRLATPCMGSTIALHRDMLNRIGGFARFADTLADDHAIGQAVIATGRTVAVPPMLVTHAFDETSPSALWRHEIRWSATVRDIAFWPYVGAIVCNPLPLALLSGLLAPLTGLALFVAALVARWIVVRATDSASGVLVAPVWMAWLHDFFGFGVYLASFFTRSVDWRGSQLRMKHDGQVSNGPETSA